VFLKAENSAGERQGAPDSRSLGVFGAKDIRKCIQKKLKSWSRVYIETGRGLR